MSLEIVIEIEGVDPAQYAEQLSEYLGSAPVQEAAARGAANVVEDHFVARDKVGNKLGGQRTHYWGEARNSVNVTSDENGGRINISKVGVALHYYGGTVVPTEKKALTIPARAEYHGRRAGEFDLSFVPAWGAGGNLIGSLQNEEGEVAYWLVKKTVHAPDASVLPPQDAMVEAASNNIVRLARRFRPPQPTKKEVKGA